MRSTILALVAVLAILGAVAPAFAGGGSKGDWELGIFGGRGFLDNYGDTEPAYAFIIGGRLGHFFSSKWSLELSGQWLDTDTDLEDPLIDDFPVKLSAYRLNLLHNFGAPGAGVRPFITVGGGSEKTEIEFPAALGGESFEQRDFGWNAGAGLRFFLSPGLNLRVEGRYVGINVGGDLDESQGNIEGTAGLSLLFGGGGPEEVAEAAPVATPNQPPSVTCTADRAEILPGETATITATATDPEGEPVTYMWTTSSGRVNGTGTSATLDFTGVTAPSSATVTVRATDASGNSATSDCSVRLAQAQVRAEAVSCIAGGFPSNRSRLNNVDKACLDDVAQRLSADPRARVIVIGSADTGETAGTAQQRADAVRDYLVNERRIEVARIESRAGTGASAQAGRQVTVWFVPEGATVPAE